jgi:hypothetical protein
MPPDLRGQVPAGAHGTALDERQFRIDTWRDKGREPNSAEWNDFRQGQHAPRSAQGIELQAFRKHFKEQTGQDPSPEDMVDFEAMRANKIAALRAAGTQAGRTEAGVVAFEQTVPLAQAASDAVPRGKWFPINQIVQKGLQASGNVAYKKFYNANEAAITEYALAIGRGGGVTVYAQQRAAHILNTADSPQAYRAGLEQLQAEVAAVEKAPVIVRMRLLRQMGVMDSEPRGGLPAAPAAAPVQDDGFGELTVK